MQEAGLNFYHMGRRDERNLDHFYSLKYLASQELSLFSLGAIVALFSLAAENENYLKWESFLTFKKCTR